MKVNFNPFRFNDSPNFKIKNFKPAVKEPITFFEKHRAKGTGVLQFGTKSVVFDEKGLGYTDISALIENDPPAKTIINTAKRFNVTVGFSGSTARNLLLGKKRLKTSDIDLIYDSRQAGFEAFRKFLLKEFKDKFPEENFVLDFSIDVNPDVNKQGLYRGLTVDKIAVLSNGNVYDFTGSGLKDLRQKVLRYNSPEPFQPPGISLIFRMIKVKIQNPEFRFEPQTDVLIRQIIEEYYSQSSENVKKILDFGNSYQSFGLDSACDYLRRMARNGYFLASAFSGLVEKIRRHHFENRKKCGENYLDIKNILEKIVKSSSSATSEQALKIIKDYKLDKFLESIGLSGKLQQLISQGRL